MKNNPKVSIVVPIYNTEKYLKNCLDSILNQTYKNLEIILVDDGSTDSSKKIIDNYAKKDSRIKVVRQKNQGQSTARNNGLGIATGDFISFIDSDDKVAKNFIEKLLEPYLANKETALTICGIHYKRLNQRSSADVFINPLRSINKNESKKAYILYLLTIDGRLYSSVNKLYIAKTAKTLKFDKKLNFAEDTKFVLDYLKKANGKINFILKPLYIYNFGTETSTINKTATVWQNWARQHQDLKAWLGENPTFREKFWLFLVYVRWHISYHRAKKRAKNHATKNPKRATRFVAVGGILTIINYILYSVLANIIFNNSDLLWLASLISTSTSTILAYIFHSRITWKERRPKKSGVYNFFIWNFSIAFSLNPLLVQLFSFLTPLYQFAYNISSAISLPFTFEFIQSTGAFCFTTILIMVLNFLFYDKIVFSKKLI